MIRPSCLLGLVLAAGAAALACGGSGALKSPTSDSQFDDPCDPGNGGKGGSPLPAVDGGATLLAIPGGAGGVGFDELRFSGTLSALLVPAGRTGDLDLIDPSTELVTAVSGFSSEAGYTADDAFGVTSADEGNGIIYATDRTSMKLDVVDPKKKVIVASATLAGLPGYVRYVQPTKEVWVTEPAQHQIEVFTLGASATVAPTSAMTIAVAGGPESLEIDATGKRAFTHAASATVKIDIPSHAVAGQWPNGCTTARGLALDLAHGWVISACEEGLVVVLDVQSGATIGTVMVGGGVDRIAYDAQRMRLYVPAPAASAMSVVQLAGNGSPSVKGSISIPSDSHCAIAPGAGQVFVCSPAQGGLLFLSDPF